MCADPPPTPPPPTPPTPPPVPVSPLAPGDAYVCNPRSLPSAKYVRDTSNLVYSPPPPPGGAIGPASAENHPVLIDNRKVVCWRWDQAGLWPPVNAHQDAYQSQEVCGGINSRQVRWEDDFRQSKLQDIYRSKLNDNTCRSANNGRCEDGGKGDSTNYQHFLWKSNGVSMTNFGTYSEWGFNRMEYTHIKPATGQFVYVHNWQTEPNSGCYKVDSSCFSGDFATDYWLYAYSRPGRLTVTSSGTLTATGTNADSQERPYFVAKSMTSAEAGRNTSYCPAPSTASCSTVALGCPTEDFAFPFPCSENIWALGASEGTPTCDYGTE